MVNTISWQMELALWRLEHLSTNLPASSAVRRVHLTKFKPMRPRNLSRASENASAFLIKGHLWLAPSLPSASLERGHDSWSSDSYFAAMRPTESQR